MRTMKICAAIAALAVSAQADAKVNIIGTIYPDTPTLSITGPSPYINDTIPLEGWLRVRFNRPVTGYFSGDGQVYATYYDENAQYYWDDNASEGGSTLFDHEKVKDVNFRVTDFRPVVPGGFIEAGATDFNYDFILYGIERPVRYSIQSIRAGAVPEPTTWAMMILGMGGVGAAMRGRKGNRYAIRV